MKIKTFKVSELNNYISKTLMSNPILHNVKVEGEIFNFKRTGYGYTFFSLKDEQSKINCIIHEEVSSEFKEGISMLVKGKLNLYEKNGTYSILVDHYTVIGNGQHYHEYMKIKEELEEKGYFDKKYKKPIPLFPKKIGLITSVSGAAVEDVIHVIEKRYPLVCLSIFDIKVQGKDAVENMIEAICYFNETQSCDLIILTRGGGSYDELSVFNDRALAEEIFKSDIPIISAVGHENDYFISDMVADQRSATPSAAAQICVPDIRMLYRQIEDQIKDIQMFFEEKLTSLESDLRYYDRFLSILEPSVQLNYKKHFLQNLYKNLEQSIKKITEEKAKQSDVCFIQLEALSPVRIINRGYASVEKEGKILSTIKDVDLGDVIKTGISDGYFTSKIIEIYDIEDEHV